MTTMKRTRWPGMVVALITTLALLLPGSALALPSNPPNRGLVCLNGASPNPTFNLVATSGDIETPDGNAVYMWSYADGSGQFQYPGPFLCVNEGDTVTINLTNILPEATSIVFPGQDAQVTASGGVAGLFTTEATANGGTVTYHFVAGSPGTYIYESGTDVSKQVEMGLYGMLVVRPSLGPNYAYDDPSTQFDPTREYSILLGEVDPDLHHAVETGGTYDFNALHNRYYTINGRSFPDTVQENGSGLLPTQPYGALVRMQPTNSIASTLPALIRMLNAGVDNHPFHPHGNHTLEIAQDGRRVASTEHFGETIGSGQTIDYLMRWDDQDNFNPINNPFPVTPPNYLDVTFKGGITWYSGSPYLGYKGQLPTGTVSLNICGEWYFPFHSHALNEFTNYDEGFGGMGTLLRVDPAGGCSAFPSATTTVSGTVKSGAYSALGANDLSYYQVNPKMTKLSASMSSGATALSVTSASGFPSSGSYYIQIQSEVMQVTGGQGTTSWTVSRGQLGTSAASHGSNATVTALADDWYATFTGIAPGAQNFMLTYKGKNCGNTSGTSCTGISTNLPLQTVKICNWTVAGASGCATPTSSGWVTLPAPQNIGVGSPTDVMTTWTLTGSMSPYIGTGTNSGQVRILVHTQRWTATNPTPFSTWGNFMNLVYDAP